MDRLKFMVIMTICIPVMLCKLDEIPSICASKEKWLMEKKNVTNQNGTETKKPSYGWAYELEELVNKQINNEMHAFYSYLSMSRFFARVDYFMEGFAKYFRDAALEEFNHAEMFMKYQATRGGLVLFNDIMTPKKQQWKDGKDVLTSALSLERNITEEILCLHHLANNKFDDSDFVNFLDESIVPEQYKGMYEIEGKIKTLGRACFHKNTDCDNYPLYEFEFDLKLQDSK